jgi:hypothetical protein
MLAATAELMRRSLELRREAASMTAAAKHLRLECRSVRLGCEVLRREIRSQRKPIDRRPVVEEIVEVLAHAGITAVPWRGGPPPIITPSSSRIQ